MPPKDLGSLRFAASGGDDSSPQAWVLRGTWQVLSFTNFSAWRSVMKLKGTQHLRPLWGGSKNSGASASYPAPARCGPMDMLTMVIRGMPIPIVLGPKGRNQPAFPIDILLILLYHPIILFFRTRDAISCFQLLRSRMQDIEDRFGNSPLDRHRPEIRTC